MADRIDDAGHGGADPGAQANGIIEKVYTLEAARYVNRRLKELGIDGDMTRTADVTLNQKDRTSKTSRYAKGISHHYNAGGGDGAEFIHSIYADGKFEKLLLDEFKKAGYPVRPNPIYSRKWGKNDYYYMHRETGNCRVTIVEYDFVDGPNASKLKNKAYREGMYECVVKAVCREEGIKYVAPKTESKPKPKPKEEDDMLEKAIVINSFADFPNAEVLANKINAPIYMRNTATKQEVAKEVIVVGGSKSGIKGKVKLLSGADRYETAAKVKAYLK